MCFIMNVNMGKGLQNSLGHIHLIHFVCLFGYSWILTKGAGMYLGLECQPIVFLHKNNKFQTKSGYTQFKLSAFASFEVSKVFEYMRKQLYLIVCV